MGKGANPSPSTEGVYGAMELADDAVSQVRTWLQRASTLRRRRDANSRRLAQLLKDPNGPAFAQGFVDRVVGPEDLSVAARNLRELGSTPPDFLAWHLSLAVRLGATFAPILPGVVVPMARKALRALIGHLIVDASAASLGKTIARLGRTGDTLNINLLGEAVLGDEEARKRLAGVRALVQRPDVHYVSIKVSSVVAQLSMWSFDDSVNRVVERLLPLYQEASTGPEPTFINLDMEEYKDLELTLEVFTRLLSHETLQSYRAGIVLQAYLPDALPAMKRLQDFAARRVAKGGAPIKVRVVKGANLLMERVDAALHGWPVTVWPTKEDTDAHYKRVIEWAMTPERVKNVQLGIAGHNLFDLAFAHHLATQRGVDQGVEAEMLLGMAPEQADAVRETLGPLVLYTPVVDHSEFDSAVAYLIRRLEENASADNFMSAVFDLHDVSVFDREEQRFRRSLARLDEDIPPRRRSQDRGAEAMIPSVPGAFANEPDTDPSLPATQEWLARIRKATGSKRSQSLGLKTLQQGLIADSLGPIGGQIAVDDLVAKMRAGAGAWAKMSARARAEVLYRAADELGRARADLLTVMMEETGKTLAEGDPEVSEAIDFSRYYAHQAIDWAGEPGVAFRPVKLTVVAPPWNFPVAIPTGSVTAALAAGSAVIIKPAPQARRCAAVMVEALWAAGVPRDVLWLADVAEGDLGRALLTHPGVDRVVLTGSFETAKLFRHWRADLPLIAETSGKNAIIITPSADIDLAVADVVKSAFGHAGQKCSAASLAIVVGSVADSARFRRKLLDAVTTLSVGYPDQPSAVVGPVIEPPGPKLRSGLTELADGETWLLEPRALDDSGRLWSPGIRDGVKPGSVFHQTEYFGPILGLVRASNLDEAIRIHNGVDYGLTAGIHSLSSAEVATWIERVEAGNLYVNRGITGAIVQRQPFGGWKKSSVGPTAKAGGPNYLSAFGRFEPIETELAPDLPEGIDSSVAGIIQAASEGATGQERAFLLRSVLSDAQAWSKHFGASPDVSGVAVEANVFRYRPAMATVRVSALTPIVEVARVLLAARSVGAQVSLSLAEKLPDPVLVALSRPGSRFGGISELHVESELAFVARVATNPPRRIRLLRGSPAALQVHFDGNPQVAIWADPVTESGRVEGLPFVHEQAVSITLHRFGGLDPRMDAVAKSL